MTYLPVIEREAEREFAEAVSFYDQCEFGLGQRFARDVWKVFQEVCKDPERYPLATRLTHKAKILNWPYSVFYSIKLETAEVIISTVWRGSRNPAKLRKRLK
jgi:hypothetical protein